jgi:hypothetical protein
VIPAGETITWQFWVRDDAKLGTLPFDLNFEFQVFAGDDVASWVPIEWRNEPGDIEIVVLQAVPEASTWILLIVGLAMLGARGWMRRPSSPTASQQCAV